MAMQDISHQLLHGLAAPPSPCQPGLFWAWAWAHLPATQPLPLARGCLFCHQGTGRKPQVSSRGASGRCSGLTRPPTEEDRTSIPQTALRQAGRHTIDRRGVRATVPGDGRLHGESRPRSGWSWSRCRCLCQGHALPAASVKWAPGPQRPTAALCPHSPQGLLGDHPGPPLGSEDGVTVSTAMSRKGREVARARPGGRRSVLGGGECARPGPQALLLPSWLSRLILHGHTGIFPRELLHQGAQGCHLTCSPPQCLAHCSA